MPATATAAGPRRRTLDVAALLGSTLVALVVFGWIAAGAGAIMSFSDSMEYVLIAEYYRGVFHGSSIADAAEFYRATRFPPLFPLFLGVSGAGVDAQPLAKQLTALCALATVPLAWTWARRQDTGAATATLVALALALSPGFFLLCLEPVSEPLAMILVFAALLLADDNRSGPSRFWTAALLVGAATLTRSICLALAVAWLGWMLCRREPRWVVLGTSALAAAPLGAWMLQRAVATGASGGESYVRALDPDWMLAELGGWHGVLVMQPLRMFGGFMDGLHVGAPSLPVTVVVAFVVALAIIGGAIRLRRNCLDAWFVPLVLGLRMAWPETLDFTRFTVFILPMIVLYAVEGAQALASRTGLVPARARILSVGAVAALLVVASGATVVRFAERAALDVDPELHGEMRDRTYFLAPTNALALSTAEASARILATARAARDVVGPQDCIYAVQPQLLRLQAGVHALEFPHQLRADVPASAQLDRCRYYFVSSVAYTGGRLGGYEILGAIAGFAEPLLAAATPLDGKPVLVAAILQRRPETSSPAAPSRIRE